MENTYRADIEAAARLAETNGHPEEAAQWPHPAVTTGPPPAGLCRGADVTADDSVPGGEPHQGAALPVIHTGHPPAMVETIARLVARGRRARIAIPGLVNATTCVHLPASSGPAGPVALLTDETAQITTLRPHCAEETDAHR